MSDSESLIVKLDIHPEELAEKVARTAITHLRNPENVAAISGALLLPLIVFRGRRVPFLPFAVVSMIGGQGGRMAWRASRDLRTIAESTALPDDDAMFPVKPDA